MAAPDPIGVLVEILRSYLTPEQLAGAIERWEAECEQRGWASGIPESEQRDNPVNLP